MLKFSVFFNFVANIPEFCKKVRKAENGDEKRKLLSALRLAIGLLAPQLKFPTPTEIWE
jgi:hypothetical protein